MQLLVVIRCTCDQLVWDLNDSSSSRAAKGDLNPNKILTITSVPNRRPILYIGTIVVFERPIVSDVLYYLYISPWRDSWELDRALHYMVR